MPIPTIPKEQRYFQDSVMYYLEWYAKFFATIFNPLTELNHSGLSPE